MAVKYVKNFSFPASQGFSGSTGKFTSVKPHVRMARGGQAKSPSNEERVEALPGDGLAKEAGKKLFGRRAQIEAEIEGAQKGKKK